VLPISGGCRKGDGGLTETICKIRSDAPPGEDPAGGVWAIRGGTSEAAGKKPATFDFLGFTGFSFLASYVWSHAIDNVDPDIPSQNPNDPNFTGAQEKGNAIYDQRNRFVLSGFYTAPWKFRGGGVATLGSGLPYNFTTGTTNGGDTGATTDRPVVDGVVVGRNAGRGRAIYSFDPFIERPFALGSDRVQLDLRAEAFNVFNHANFVGYGGTWGNGAASGTGFGLPLAGITNQLPARSLQFSAKVTF